MFVRLAASVTAAALVAACYLSHDPPVADEPVADTPRTCELRPDGASGLSVLLEPDTGNPASCSADGHCEVWFGHGQHLRCPRFLGPPSPIEVECDIWDCVCVDGAGFVADFATGEAQDSRDGAECRYQVIVIETP
jgi:hypothetical protein